MKKILPILLAVALAAFSLWWFGLRGEDRAITYETERVARGDIEEVVSSTGTVEAVSSVEVGSQVSGRVEALHADFNDRVEKGKLIAEIDPAPFLSRLEEARAGEARAEAEVRRARASLREALRDHERKLVLNRKGYLAGSELEGAEAALEVARADIDMAEAGLRSARASVERAGVELSHTRISSPVTGVVISRDVDEGQTVTAGFETPKLFTIAKSLETMRIKASVDEADIGRIREGIPVDFRVDAHPEHSFKGTVAQVRINPVELQNVVTYNVMISTENTEGLLMPGMTAEVNFIVKRGGDVLKVPAAALRFRPPAAWQAPRRREPGRQMGVETVWRLAAEGGEPEPIGIETGITDGMHYELQGGDLEEGDALVTEVLGEQEREVSNPFTPDFSRRGKK